MNFFKTGFYTVFFVLAGAAFLLSSCGKDDGSRNIESYYFPLEKMKNGLVYEYQPVGETYDPPIFWHYQSVRQEGSRFLLGRSYDQELSPDQFSREERVDNGMLLAGFRTYEADFSGKKVATQAKIDAANIFPFKVKEPYGVLLSSFHWNPPGDSATITLIKNRQFNGDTAVVFDGKNLPAVKFITQELVDHEKQGHLELEFGGMEVYAKDIGLVYFRKDIEEWLMQYRLAQIYSVEDFEKKFNTKLESLR